jgi:hypothetical protein
MAIWDHEHDQGREGEGVKLLSIMQLTGNSGTNIMTNMPRMVMCCASLPPHT